MQKQVLLLLLLLPLSIQPTCIHCTSGSHNAPACAVLICKHKCCCCCCCCRSNPPVSIVLLALMVHQLVLQQRLQAAVRPAMPARNTVYPNSSNLWLHQGCPSTDTPPICTFNPGLFARSGLI
jgi:hypothetical protein